MDVLTQFIEALSCLGDLSAAPLELTLEPLAQVQDTNDPPQQVAGHLECGGESGCGKPISRLLMQNALTPEL